MGSSSSLMPCVPTTGEPGRGRWVRGKTPQPLAWGQGCSSPQLTCPLSLFSPLCSSVRLGLGTCACWDLPSLQRERPLAADDLRTVQTSLLGLVREFLVRSSSSDDLQVVLNFLAAGVDDGQVGWRLVRVRLG